MKKGYLSFLLLAALLLGGCAVNPVTGEQDFVLMSEDDEIAIGRENHAMLLKRFGKYDDPALNQYVQRIGETLAAKSHRSNLIYRFTVLDTQDINAFALPGGYIYITRGLIAYLGNEAELGAVLGHEIGHVTARHAVRQHSAATATGILAAVLASQTGVQGTGDLFNAIGTALVRGYGREHELESDRLGAEYLAQTNYDPLAMLNVIRVLKNQETFDRKLAEQEDREPNVYHGVFSTHPDNDTRLQEVIGRAKRLQKPNGNLTNQAEFLRHVEGLVFGESEKEGVLRGNTFYHRELGVAIEMPKGWRIENKPDRLVAIAPKNEGIMQVQALDLNRRLSPKDFINQRLKLDDLSNAETFTHNNLQGYTAVSPVRTPYGERKTRVVVLYRGDKAWVFQGAAKDESHPFSFDRLFLAAARSFRDLQDHERELSKPRRLHVITAKPGMTYAQLARDSKLGPHAEAYLRLLNNQYPDGEPVANTALKIVQ